MPQARCCQGFSRSQFLRRSAAVAGQGLPAIEPGMPLPAGTGLSRRSFLMRTAGVALSIYGASALAPEAFEQGIAEAAAAAPSQPVLLSVFMAGGADSLSILAPVGDPLYPTLRPGLKLDPGSGTTFSEDTRLMWAADAAPLATLHGEGKVTVMPAIAYDHPDQSHFTSRHYWEVGVLDPFARLGWMGRYLDRYGSQTNPLQGLSLDSSLSPSLAPQGVPVAAVESPSSYTFDARNVWSPIDDRMREAFESLAHLYTPDPSLAYARGAQSNAAQLRRQLEPFSSFTVPAGYPNTNFARQLASLAGMLAIGLPLRCVTMGAPGGYDTHADQAGSLANNLRETSDALLAFQRDLESKGLADRVLTHVWTEFGRRPEENGSAGTDHGAAGLSLLIGTRAHGQMVGEYPGLAQLDQQDNLRATSDFRAVYCALLEQWFAADAAAVIPGASAFARPQLVT